ncbi:MAG: TerB family tellurite resistance protein [Phycisphaerae bacterium]|nr:TerB family tellurite resistance protein [Phycisphaerae bacterium]
MTAPDNMNCLKNLMRLMCCDGVIQPQEKAFLSRAATELAVLVDDWNALLREVISDNISFYPVSNREKALAALKAMVVMAKTDGQVDEKEKQFVLQFAKSFGVSQNDWKEVLSDIDPKNLFGPFQKPPEQFIALTDDFEKLEAFLKVAQDNGAAVQTKDLKAYLRADSDSQAIVCFHASPEKELTVSRCQLLLGKAGERLVCILNRFQGHQVKYLHETGLKKCVIEPVYARDISDILKKH